MWGGSRWDVLAVACHLLAVSGQNVTLLALLASPLLGFFGLGLRERLVWLLGAIAVYVAVTGAGPSIQRAGVMGGLGVLAMLSGRRSSRLHALGVAAVVTLALDPDIARDVGWQLSFAAVLGIALCAAPAARALRERLGASGPLATALVEGVTMTVAASLATAPLIAFHFGRLSTVTVLANVLALPAVAPAMWLGMLAAVVAQVPGLPVEAANLPNALLLGYIAQVAAWCAGPSWASLPVRLGTGGLAASYAAIAAALLAARLRVSRSRRADRRGPPPRGRPVAAARGLGAPLALLAALLAAASLFAAGDAASGPPAGLRVTVLDVGQGDAILFQQRSAPAVLVDAGPPGAGLDAMLREAGVTSLGAAVVTHDQSDHAGGVEDVLGELPVGALAYGSVHRGLIAEARAAGARPRPIAAGDELRAGRLRLDAVWPPRELLAGGRASREDPNRLALVFVARWGRFSMLLCADAEAEAVPIDPGPVDVLKVAHHGSDDAGLAELLRRARPALAVISVGAGNPYGHPTRATLAALAAHGVRTLRTDRDGPIVIEVGHAGAVVGHG